MKPQLPSPAPPVEVVNELRRADAVLTTKTHYRRGSHLVRAAESSGTPVYVLRKNTIWPQIQEFLRAISKDGKGQGREWQDPESEEEFRDVMESAIKEAEEAAQRVLGGESSIKLAPQKSYVRATATHPGAAVTTVSSISHGRDPARSVMFYRALTTGAR